MILKRKNGIEDKNDAKYAANDDSEHGEHVKRKLSKGKSWTIVAGNTIKHKSEAETGLALASDWARENIFPKSFQRNREKSCKADPSEGDNERQKAGERKKANKHIVHIYTNSDGIYSKL